VHDPCQAWWIAMYVVVAGRCWVVAVRRSLPFNARHRLEIVSVEPEAPNVVSVG